jgi:hypothetical protein
MGDYILADRRALAIAERVAAAGVESYLGPVLPFGCADYFFGLRPAASPCPNRRSEASFPMCLKASFSTA